MSFKFSSSSSLRTKGISIITLSSTLVQYPNQQHKALEGFSFCISTHLHAYKIELSVKGASSLSHADPPPFELKDLLCFTLGKAFSEGSTLILGPTPKGYNPQISSPLLWAN
jgi:hypothetical protein